MGVSIRQPGISKALADATYIAKALMTTRGDMIRENVTPTPERFAKGAQGTILKMGVNDPDWLAKGLALQVLRVNAGATDLEFATPAAGVAIVNTQVFNGNAPGSTYTDLNLSAVVGANEAIVLLLIIYSAAYQFAFRTNGQTYINAYTDLSLNVGVVAAAANEHAYVLVKTDASGIVEWISGQTTAVIINVSAYWK